MKKLIYFLAIFSTAVSLSAADVEMAHAVKNGKPLVIAPEKQTTMIAKSSDLLSSCAYTEKLHEMPGDEKASHIHFKFANPRKIEAPILNGAIEVKEMVVTFPLGSGRIYVRTEDGVILLTKFRDHELGNELQSLFNDLR